MHRKGGATCSNTRLNAPREAAFELMVDTQGDGPLDQGFHKQGKALFAQLIAETVCKKPDGVYQLQGIEMAV